MGFSSGAPAPARRIRPRATTAASRSTERERMILLDGPLGTELERRGIETPPPGWSAYAIDRAPEIIAAIHRDYAAAGATVHTANTFRTKRRQFPERWQALTEKAIAIARASVPSSHRIAASIAPLEDCWRP